MSGLGDLSRSYGGGFTAPDPNSRSQQAPPGGYALEQQSPQQFSQMLLEALMGMNPNMGQLQGGAQPAAQGTTQAAGQAGDNQGWTDLTAEAPTQQTNGAFGLDPAQSQMTVAQPEPTPFMDQYKQAAGAGMGNSLLMQVLGRIQDLGTRGQEYNERTGQYEQHPGVNGPGMNMPNNPIETFMGILDGISDSYNRGSQGGRGQTGYMPQDVSNPSSGAWRAFNARETGGASQPTQYSPGSNAGTTRPPGALTGDTGGGALASAQVAGNQQQQPPNYAGSYGPMQETFNADLVNQYLNQNPALFGQAGQTGMVDPMAAYLAQVRGQSQGQPGTNTKSSGYRDVPAFLERFSPYAGLLQRFA